MDALGIPIRQPCALTDNCLAPVSGYHMIIVSILGLVGWMLFLEAKLSIPFSYTGAIVVSAAVSLIYVGAFFGYLGLVKDLVLLSGNVVLLYTLGSSWRRKDFLASSWFLWVSMIVAIGCLYYKFMDAKIYGWDEYFWGEFAKYLYYSDRYWTAASPILPSYFHAAYPPGFGLLQNLFMFGMFSESAMYFANNFLLVCLVFVAARIYLILGGKGRIMLAAYLILIVCAAKVVAGTLCGPSISHILIDSPLGVVFAMAILVASFEPDHRLATFFLACLLPFLTLLKANAIILTLTTLLVYTTAQVADARGAGTKVALRTLPRVAAIGTVSLLFLAFWTINLQLGGISVKVSSYAMDASVVVAKLFNVPRLHATLLAFVKALFCTSLTPFGFGPVEYVTSLLAILVLTLYSVISYAKAVHSQSRRVFIIFGSLFFGLAVWILFHLYLWLVVYGDFEGLSLGGFQRYIGTYAMALVIFALTLACVAVRSKAEKIILVLMALVGLAGMVLITPDVGDVIKIKWDAFEGEAAFLEAHTEPASRIWLIAQGSTGREVMALRYKLAPERVVGIPHVHSFWSLGEPYSSEDIWTVRLSLAALKNMVRQYNIDYLMLHSFDKTFVASYFPGIGLEHISKPVLLNVSDWIKNAELPVKIVDIYTLAPWDTNKLN